MSASFCKGVAHSELKSVHASWSVGQEKRGSLSAGTSTGRCRAARSIEPPLALRGLCPHSRSSSSLADSSSLPSTASRFVSTALSLRDQATSAVLSRTPPSSLFSASTTALRGGFAAALWRASELDDSYTKRVSYRLAKWSGIAVEEPLSSGRSRRPHQERL